MAESRLVSTRGASYRVSGARKHFTLSYTTIYTWASELLIPTLGQVPHYTRIIAGSLSASQPPPAIGLVHLAALSTSDRDRRGWPLMHGAGGEVGHRLCDRRLGGQN